MRIIAGTAGGRRLSSPPGMKVRPTTDRIRESLFSMLGDLNGATVVDGFAGSGALGLESLSRGATHAFFFDPYRAAIATVRKNVETLDMADRAVVHHCDFESGLKRITGTPDLWFLDPPYESGEGQRALKALDELTCVTEGALVVWESADEEEAPRLERLKETRLKDYGSTWIRFYRCTKDACP